MFELSKQSDKAPELEMYAKVLFDQALLTEGSPLADPAAFAREVTKLLLKGIGGRE